MRKKLLASLLALVMVIGLPPATVLAVDFSDTNGHWGQSAINRWADVGILSGKGDGNFDPNGTMTRAEFAQMLSNMMGYTSKAANVFTDVPSGAWYEDAMLKLMAAGVIQGNGDGTANPNGPITREQAAVMLCRAFDIQPSRNASLTYNDSASISSWARDAMAALAERGMMNGVGDNTAAPLAIKSIWNKAGEDGGFPAPKLASTGDDVLARIYDTTANDNQGAFISVPPHEYKLLDIYGRTQDIVTVTIDATGCVEKN